MCAGASARARLIRASCSTQARYSSSVRSGQIASLMIRTRCPGCSCTNAVSTEPRIRPGLRPDTAMSRIRTCAASCSYDDADGYVTDLLGFVRGGLARDEPVLIAVPRPNLALLHAGLSVQA